MRTSTTERLLRLLERSAGEKIPVKKLLEDLREKPLNRDQRRSKNKRGSRDNRPAYQDDPAMTLAEIELLGMIENNGKYIIPVKPFVAQAKVSMSPQGMVFAVVRSADPMARDIFIPPERARNALPGDEILVRLEGRKRDRFEGSVVEVIRRARTLYRMKLLSGPQKKGIPGIVLDTSSKPSAALITDRIPHDILNRLKENTTIVVNLTGGTIQLMGAPFLEAKFVRMEDDRDPDFDRILMKYNLDPVYPDTAEIPDYPEDINETNVTDWKSRKDLRDLYTITIDGADSKDFDDAISLVPLKKNLWKLYVHIADVSYYVPPGSSLDDEALERSTSVYPGGRVIPMLPPVLSENLCSLVAQKNRLAFTAEMDVRPGDGSIIDYKIYKSIIKVDRRLTYDIAEDLIDSSEENLKRMWDLAQLQKKSRLAEGRIDLNIPEPSWTRDSAGEITGFVIKKRLKSSQLIEEFMLSANTVTAEFLRKKYAIVLYRIHEQMDETKLENLNAFFKIYKVPFELKSSDPADLQKALVAAQKKGETVEKIFNMLLLRSFMQASYRPAPSGHWGLAMRDYCHFTSPIRRYPDLIVHRALECILNKKKSIYHLDEMEMLGAHTSDRERKAMEAERDLNRLRIMRFIEKSGKKQFRGFITGFRPDRVFLELEELPAEGIVRYTHLTDDTELILPDKFSVYVKRLSRPAFLGEMWDLEIENIDLEEIRIYFKPIWKSAKSVFR